MSERMTPERKKVLRAIEEDAIEVAASDLDEALDEIEACWEAYGQLAPVAIELRGENERLCAAMREAQEALSDSVPGLATGNASKILREALEEK